MSLVDEVFLYAEGIAYVIFDLVTIELLVLKILDGDPD